MALGAALVPAGKTVQTRGDRVLPYVITLHREPRRKGVTPCNSAPNQAFLGITEWPMKTAMGAMSTYSPVE